MSGPTTTYALDLLMLNATQAALDERSQRLAVEVDTRREIEAAIPAGYTIGVTGQARGGGRIFDLWALGPGVDERGRSPEILRLTGRRDPVAAAKAIAERLQGIAECWTLTAAVVSEGNGGQA